MTDTYINNVILYLPFDNLEYGTGYLPDYSLLKQFHTKTGNVFLSADKIKYGNASAYFNETSLLLFNYSSLPTFFQNDWTIETWMAPLTTNYSGGTKAFFGGRDQSNHKGASIYVSWANGILNGLAMELYNPSLNGAGASSMAAVNGAGAWNHVAVCKSGLTRMALT